MLFDLQAAQAFAKALPDGRFENWSKWRIYSPHTSALVRNTTVDSVDTAAIYFSMSWYLRLVGRYDEAEDLARRSAEVRADFLGQGHLSTLTSMANLASTCRDQRWWKQAEGAGSEGLGGAREGARSGASIDLDQHRQPRIDIQEPGKVDGG